MISNPNPPICNSLLIKYLGKKVRLVDMKKDSELVTISSKGQIVIPKALRHELQLTPKSKMLVYGERDTVILKKVEIPRIYKDWADVFNIIRRKKLKLTARDVQKEIESYRSEKRLKMTK